MRWGRGRKRLNGEEGKYSTTKVISWSMDGRLLDSIRNDADMHARAFYTHPRTRSTYMSALAARFCPRFPALWPVDVLPLTRSGFKKVNVVSLGLILKKSRHDIMTLFVLSLSKYSKNMKESHASRRTPPDELQR